MVRGKTRRSKSRQEQIDAEFEYLHQSPDPTRCAGVIIAAAKKRKTVPAGANVRRPKACERMDWNTSAACREYAWAGGKSAFGDVYQRVSNREVLLTLTRAAIYITN